MWYYPPSWQPPTRRETPAWYENIAQLRMSPSNWIMSYIVYSAFVLCCAKIHLMVWNSVNVFKALAMRRLLTHRMHLMGEGRFSGSMMVPGPVAEQLHLLNVKRIMWTWYESIQHFLLYWLERNQKRKKTNFWRPILWCWFTWSATNILVIPFYTTADSIFCCFYLQNVDRQTLQCICLQRDGTQRHTDAVFARRFWRILWM